MDSLRIVRRRRLWVTAGSGALSFLFYDALQSLSVNPGRCVLAPENPKSKRTLHQYLFGKGRNVFRVVFTIEDDTVWIIRIRRAARKQMTKNDLGEARE